MNIRAFLLALGSLMVLPLHAEDWKLMWADEFNYQGLPDSSKWGYEEGFVRNGEKQYYTRERLENARVEGGMLIIEGRKEEYQSPKYSPGTTGNRETSHYTSASLTTQKTFSFTYGRVEMRAKIPQGLGVWPAFWTLGLSIPEVGWPRCGEIDVMEFVGHDPTHIHGTVHFAVDGKHRSNGGPIEVSEPYSDFHVYAAEWYPDRIDLYFDKTLYHSFPLDLAGVGADNPFRKPHFILINLALGGSWGGKIDNTIFPQQYQIDYVRVYQKSK